MKTIRLFTLIALVVLCSLATFAQVKDPKIIIHGTSGGGAPTMLRQCPRTGCTPVGVNFSFTIGHNGGPPLGFHNDSGQDWTALTLTETGVPAQDVSCAQTLYLTCTVTAQQDGSTQIVLAGIKGLNPRNGILAGADFTIGFACVNRSCWPRGLNFTGQATTAFQTVDFPGAVSTFLYGINNAGQMVGAYVNDDESTHGFLLSNGVFTTIDFPGSTLSVAAGINNHGVIAGQYNDSQGFGHGFVYSDGEFGTRDLDGYQTFPTAIDDAGDLVGFCVDSEFNFHGCVAFDGFNLFDFPGATASLALGIDFQGFKIAGGYGNINGSSFEHGYLYEDGFSTLDFPGAATTVAFGINDHDNDLTVGTYTVSDNNANNGFGLTSGNFSTRNVPGALQTNPVNLNDSNQVVGWYVDGNNMTHGYLMSQ